MKSDSRRYISKLWFLPIILALSLTAYFYWQTKFVPQPITLLAPDTYQVTHLALSPDGKQLAEVIAASSEPVIRFFSTETGQVQTDSSPVQDFPYRLSSGAPDKNRVSFANQKKPLVWISYAPDGKTLNSIDSTGAFLEWDTESGKSKRVIPTLLPPQSGRVIIVSPDGQKVITLRGSISCKNPPLIWDRATGKLQGRLKVNLWAWFAMTFSPDGRVIASAEKDHTIKLWDAQNGKLLRTLSNHRGGVATLTFSPDGNTLVSSSNNFKSPQKGSELRFCRVSDGFELHRPISAPDWIEHLCFTPDGRLAGSGFKSVFLWDILTGKMVQKVRGNWPISFAESSKLMAAKDTDGFGMGHDVLLWNYR